MTYLDIRSNNFNSYAVEEFSRYLRTTEVLQYLNISACQLWGRVAEKVIDALMLNTTLQYLDISHNRFTSKNYIIAAKVGFRQRSTGGKKEIRSHKDKNQVLQMASGEV